MSKRLGYDHKTETLDPDFCMWAWGVSITDKVFHHPIQLLDLWNRRHGDKLRLSPKGSLFEGLALMSGVWALSGYPTEME